MAWFALGRVLFVATVTCAAALLRPLTTGGLPVNVLFGLVLAGLVVALERLLRQTPPSRLLGALIGFIGGLAIANAIEAALFWTDPADHRVEFLHGFLLIVLPYLGLVLGAKNGEWLEPVRLVGLFRPVGPERRYKILDTSVIIDGRIADIADTGFLDGVLVIPQFVLRELQLVADSSDSMSTFCACICPAASRHKSIRSFIAKLYQSYCSTGSSALEGTKRLPSVTPCGTALLSERFS